jgi:hypothetical protein
MVVRKILGSLSELSFSPVTVVVQDVAFNSQVPMGSVSSPVPKKI